MTEAARSCGANGKSLLQDLISKDQEELRIWRERYPLIARNVREEAEAKVEGREPNYQPPFGIL